MILRIKENAKNKTINHESLLHIGFIVFFFAWSGNRLDEGIDAYIRKFAIVFYVAVFMFHWLITNLQKDKRRKFSFAPIGWYFLFVGFGFLSVLWAMDQNLVFLQKSAFIQMIILCAIVPYSISNNKELEKYLKIVLAGVVYETTILIIRVPFSEWKSTSEWSNNRLGGAIGWHSNYFGWHLAIATCICIFLIYNKYGKFIIKNMYAWLSAFFVYTMFYTGSRSSILFLFVFLICYFIYIAKDAIKLVKYMFIIGILMTAIMILIFNIESLYNSIGYRFEQFFNDIFGITSKTLDASNAERDYFAEKAIEAFNSSPIVGIGLYNYKYYISSIGYDRALSAHNNYLELLCDVGIIGTAIFYSFIFYVLTKLFLLMKTHDYSLGWAFAIIAALVIHDMNEVKYYYPQYVILILLAYCSFKIFLKKKDCENDKHKI